MDWLSTYLQYTRYFESPRSFHLWSAIACLGHLMGRKVWMQRGGLGEVYPGQINVVLVAKSAMLHKSAAVRKAASFLKGLEPHEAFILPKKTSPQELLHMLQRISKDEKEPMRDPETGKQLPGCGLIVADEMSVFFSNESFADALAGHFNDLNDAPKGLFPVQFRTWGAELYYPCVSILSAITPKGIAKELPRACRQAGFFGRILWVYENHTTRANSLTTIPPGHGRLRRDLREGLGRIIRMRGPMRMTARAVEWYDQWYYDQHLPELEHRDMQGYEMNETGYWGRRSEHLCRVAMVFSASESSRYVTRHTAQGKPYQQYWCKQRHLERALKELQKIEVRFEEAFAEIGVVQTQDYDLRLVETLKRHGGYLPRWKVLQLLIRYGSAARLDAAERSLVEARKIRVVTKKRKTVAYRLPEQEDTE